MYPIWPVESVAQLIGSECLAGRGVNTEAPACQTRANRVPNRCALGQVSVSRFVAHIVAPFRMTLAYPIAGMHAWGPERVLRSRWKRSVQVRGKKLFASLGGNAVRSRTSEPLTFWTRSSICSGKDHLSQRQRSNRQEDSRCPSGSPRFYQWRDDREIPCVFPTRG